MFSRRGKLSSRMIGLLILATFSVLIIILHRDAGPYKYLEPVHKAYENLRKVQHSIFSNDKFIRPKVGHSLKGHDPLLEPVGPPPGQLWGPGERGRAPATIMSLVRNEEVDDMVQSILELERTFNHKFNYPWTFFNDVPFSEEFKRKTREATKAEVSYETIPEENWKIPSWIDEEQRQQSAQNLADAGVQYAQMTSYHQMCRWNSGLFFKHPALQKYKWYWRVEPKVHFYCSIDYDVFHYMSDHNKTYGFVINIYDSPQSINTLWPQTQAFLTNNPHTLHQNNALPWLTNARTRPLHNSIANGYSTCHFWSNFEIASLDFFRSDTYTAYFDHLDQAGGFFYERWGDAPVHSIALALFEDRNKIHWFKDIGYEHIPYFNCPNSPKCSGCVPGQFTNGQGLDDEDCRASWFEYVHMD